MFGKIIFAVACALFLASLFVPTVLVGDTRSLTGLETFYYTLRYGTAHLFGAQSFSDFVVNFVALVAAAANFVFVFWALLVFAPTRITLLKWFWWVSVLFLIAATYTGIQAKLSDELVLQNGYFYWISALILMLVAPVVTRMERSRSRRTKRVGGGKAHNLEVTVPE